MEPEGGDFARDNRMVVTGTSRLVFAQKKRRYDAGQDLEEIEGCGGGCHGLSHLCQQLCVATMACLPGVGRRLSALCQQLCAVAIVCPGRLYSFHPETACMEGAGRGEQTRLFASI